MKKSKTEKISNQLTLSRRAIAKFSIRLIYHQRVENAPNLHLN